MTASTIPAEVTAKLALIGSSIVGEPQHHQRPANNSDRAQVGWWFRAQGRCYMCVSASAPGRYISTGEYLDGGNRAGLSDMDGAMIGWQQPQDYTAVEISEPKTPDAKPAAPAPKKPDASAIIEEARGELKVDRALMDPQFPRYPLRNWVPITDAIKANAGVVLSVAQAMEKTDEELARLLS